MGDAVRRILRKVGSAGRWSIYNLKGGWKSYHLRHPKCTNWSDVSIFSGLPLVGILGRGVFMWMSLYSISFRGLYCFLLAYFCIEIHCIYKYYNTYSVVTRDSQKD